MHCGEKEDVWSSIVKGMLRWFGHIERKRVWSNGDRRNRHTRPVWMGELEGVNLSEHTLIRLRTLLAKASLGASNYVYNIVPTYKAYN